MILHVELAGCLAHVSNRLCSFLQFSVGMPVFVPSIQMGSFGAITPLKSSPPSLKALFDFSIAGPLAGLLASLVFLVEGLTITASMDLQQSALLPALPLYLLRASSLGGGLIEMFLGQGSLMQGIPEDAVLPLHPFAVAGFVGLLWNSVALLPLGRKSTVAEVILFNL